MFFENKPRAKAHIKGGPLRPQINGDVWFLDGPDRGTYILVHVEGLPPYRPGELGKPPIGPFGFHIHSGSTCIVGNPENPFLSAGEHYNPNNQPHGNHAGDLPNLFSMDGKAIMVFYTNRFCPLQVIGKTIIIHENPDDSRTQPSGNSGLRLACGEIKSTD